MKIESFRIKNFKGISTCKIEIENSANPIITLIGLNESGKTTILEAIANFIGEDRDLLSVIGAHRPKSVVKDFIPKHRKANFSDVIELEATVSLDEKDGEALRLHFLTEHQLKLDVSVLPKTFTINKTHTFKDSEPTTSTNYWSIVFFAKSGNQRNTRPYSAPNERDIWYSGIKCLTKMLPRICYFPTFLFEIPERIYLEGAGMPSDSSPYYKRILQDVLDAQAGKLNLQTHVVDRIEKYRKTDAQGSVSLQRAIEQDTRDNIDHLFRKMSTELNRVIFGAWNEIFEKRPKNKRIEIKWDLDAKRGHAVYCQITVLDNEESYALSERSLGFRWFFCFLLFTQFGMFRGEGRKTFFLLDEPASNLHSSAQAKLLASLPRMSGDNNVVIYSTHSHYMIEPLWLEQSYIVTNKAIAYDDGGADADYFSGQPTEISAQKYRNFVGQHKNQATYFQPVLDCLEYRASSLIGSQSALIVEGKHDFFAFKYLLPRFDCTDVDIVPGAGAGNMETLISLYMGWGRKFLILLDDDKKGRDEKRRYIEHFLLPNAAVATLGDACSELIGAGLEGVFDDQVKKLVSDHFSLQRPPKKKDFALYFQELGARGQEIDIGNMGVKTKTCMANISNFVLMRLKND